MKYWVDDLISKMFSVVVQLNFCLFILASIICTAWQHSSLRYTGVQIGWIIEQLKVLQSHDHVHLRGDRQREECLAWPEEGSVWQLYSFKVFEEERSQTLSYRFGNESVRYARYANYIERPIIQLLSFRMMNSANICKLLLLFCFFSKRSLIGVND